jgi:DNA polymerase-3 subunit delta
MDHNGYFDELKRGDLKDLYLFHGDEEYVMKKALEQAVSTVEETVREVNTQVFKNGSWDEVIAACDTMPFFSERRIIICNDLPVEKDAEKVLSYLPYKPKSSVLIFVKHGKAAATLSIYKAVNAKGGVVSFDKLPDEDAVKWAVREAGKKGVRMDVQAARHLFIMTGSDLTSAEKELSKALAYAGPGGTITKEILNRCVTRNIEYGVFDMLEYFLAGKTAEGIRALDFLLKDGEPPMMIASFLTGRFKLMLAGKKLLDSGMDLNSAVSALAETTKSRSAYAARKAIENCKRFTYQQLIDASRAFMDVGFLQIEGAMRGRDTLELALISLAQK